MKILAIGNSFSQDATAYVEDIAASLGQNDVIAANLYIGGCPLSHHAENLKTDKVEYEYQRHGVLCHMTSIREALKSDAWDIVTLQQVSGHSGIYDSYRPYIDEVYAEVRSLCPDAEIYLHRTWAYEEESTHPDFVRYDRDRAKMDAAIEDVYLKMSTLFSAKVIPVGNVITMLKQMPEFDLKDGGISLYRDRFHLSLTYGRYAAALVWLEMLCGVDTAKATFVPEGAQADLVYKVRDAVKDYLKKD